MPLETEKRPMRYRLLMLTFRQTFFSLFGLIILAGCAVATQNQPDVPLMEISGQPSLRARQIYSYLKIERAMRHDDAPALIQAADELLKINPSSRPLADAAGWLLGNGRHKEANHILQQAIHALPDDLALHVMLAETLLEEGQAAQAIELVRKFSATHPDDYGAKIELALFYMRSEQPANALRVFEELPEAELTPTVRYYMAQAQKMTGDLAGASAMLRAALNEAPNFLEVMLELAFLEETRENFAEARKLFTELLSHDQNNQDIRLHLLLIAMKEGNPNRAMEIAKNMPDSYGFTLAATSVFMNEGRYDLAEELLARLAKLPDTPSEIAFYQATAAYEGHREATRALKYLEAIEPGNRYYSQALHMRIQILFEENRLDNALLLAREGLKSFPEEESYELMEIELLIAMKNYAGADEALGRMIAASPDDMALPFRRAYLHELAGNSKQAMLMMEDLLERDPENAQVLNFIGYTLAHENRDLDRALILLEKAAALEPEADFIIDSLAWVQYRLGRFADAWDSIQRAVSLSDPQDCDPLIWEHYGDIALAAGFPDKAREGWQKSLELSPEDPAAIQAKLENLK